MRKLVWRVVVGLVLFILALPVATWFVIDFGGKRALKETEAALRAEGEATTLSEFVRGPIADEQNWCAIPALKGIYVVEGGDPEAGEPARKRKRLEALLPDPVPDRREYHRSASGLARRSLREQAFFHLEHLEALPASERAAAEAWLSWFAEGEMPSSVLAVHLDRAKARFQPGFPEIAVQHDLSWAVLMPHLNAVQHAAKALHWEALARLRLGQGGQALDCMEALARLAEACSTDGVLIDILVASTVEAILLHVVQEGLWSGLWGDEASRMRCEDALRRSSVFSRWPDSVRLELAGALDNLRFLGTASEERARYLEQVGFASSADNWEALLIRVMPPGLFLENGAWLGETHNEFLLAAFRRGEGAAGMMRAADDTMGKASGLSPIRRPLLFAAVMSLGIYPNIQKRLIYAETRRRQALIVLALERHREGEGDYPDKLSLLPSPADARERLDPVDGKPMRYHLDPSGDFLLYSIGFDGVDDLGEMTLDEDRPWRARFHHDTYLGDWLWVREPMVLPPIEDEKEAE